VSEFHEIGVHENFDGSRVMLNEKKKKNSCCVSLACTQLCYTPRSMKAVPPTPPISWSEQPLHVGTDHFLNDFSNVGLFSLDKNSPGFEPIPSPPVNNSEKTEAYVVVNVSEISSIDTSMFQFKAKLRMYVVWRVNIVNFGLAHLMKKAIVKKEYYSLNESEVTELLSVVPVPDLSFYNAMESKELDLPSIRVYPGGGGALMWNRGYSGVFRETFELQKFPFDVQELTIELRQDNSKTWDLFDLRVHAVMFNRQALELSEWQLLEPLVKYQFHKSTDVKLMVLRKPEYYLQNVVLVLMLCSSFALMSFVSPLSDASSRLGTSITLLLTNVAFKFATSGSLPKVTYNTRIDYFMLLNMCFLFAVALLGVFGALLQPHVDVNLNLLFFVIAVVGYTAAVSVWALSSYSIFRQNESSTRLMLPVEGKKFYQCRYANVPFMSPISMRSISIVERGTAV
jgi:hypothetical protein